MKTVFILAGGKGERMLPLTEKHPKPMLKIANKPMLEYVLNLAVANGFKKVGINLYYLGEQVRSYFSDGKKFGAKIFYIEENELTGTAGAVKAIAKQLKPKEPFFVISSDMMINFPLSKIYEFHIKHKGIATVCCYFRKKEELHAKKSGLVVFDQKTNIVNQFVERPQTEKEIISSWVNSSVYLFSPEILRYIPEDINGSKVIDIPKNIFPILFRLTKKIYAFPIDPLKYYQLGIDTPDRIKRAEDDIKSKKFIPAASF